MSRSSTLRFDVVGVDVAMPTDGTDRTVVISWTEPVTETWTVVVDGAVVATLASGGDELTATFPKNKMHKTWRLARAGQERVAGRLLPREVVPAATDIEGLTVTVGDGDTLTISVLGGGGGGRSSVTVSDEAPTDPAEGDQWWDTTDGSMNLWVGDPGAWVETNPVAPVSSVNGETGAVVLTASDVGAVPTSGGTFTGPVRSSITAGTVAQLHPNGEVWLDAPGRWATLSASRFLSQLPSGDAGGGLEIGDDGRLRAIDLDEETSTIEVRTPTAASEAANKSYVDAAAPLMPLRVMATQMDTTLSVTQRPGSGNRGSSVPVIGFPDAALTTDPAAPKGYVPPIPWASVDIYLLWMNISTTDAGVVRWVLNIGPNPYEGGGTPRDTSISVNSASVAVVPGVNTGVPVSTLVASAVPVSTPVEWSFAIRRHGDHVDDTLATIAYLRGIEIRKAGT